MDKWRDSENRRKPRLPCGVAVESSIPHHSVRALLRAWGPEVCLPHRQAAAIAAEDTYTDPQGSCPGLRGVAR